MRTRYFNLRIPKEGNHTESVELIVADGRFEEILPAGTETAAGNEQWVDLDGALVLPGAIDGHVHFDDPGFTQREDFSSGTSAAAAGGVTCVVDMPCTSLPPIVTTDALENKLKIIGPKAHVDYMLWGGVSGNAMTDRQWRVHLNDLVDEREGRAMGDGGHAQWFAHQVTLSNAPPGAPMKLSTSLATITP